MEKMKIFIGPPASGKSRKAREITEGKNTVWINGRNLRYLLNSNFLFSELTEKTEYLVFDDCVGAITQLAFRLFPEKLIVHRKRKHPIEVPRPKIIIITGQLDYKFDTSASFLRRFDFVKFPTQN